MYNEMSAGAVCVIAKTLPQGLECYRTAHPGELIIDRAIRHKGEIYPSYRIENGAKDDTDQPLWINGLFLDFVRYIWDESVKQPKTALFGEIAIGTEFKPTETDCWHLKTDSTKGAYQSFGTRYEPTFKADQTVFID